MKENNHLRQLSNLELLAKQVVEGFITGLHKSPFHGFSVEFAEHRQYNSGESTRHIDWKLYARTDKYFVKRYEEETNLRCRIIIDTSSSMYFPNAINPSQEKPNKLYFSSLCAASIMNILKKQRDAVGLSLFNENVSLHTQEKTSSVHHQFLLHQLEKEVDKGSSKSTTNVSDALHQIADHINQRSLVIIFSDMMQNDADNDTIFSALRHLKFNKHEVILFHVMDKSKEVEFEYDNRPYKFIDMETGEEVKLSPNQIKQNYIAASKSFRNSLKIKCNQYKIDFVEADINQGYNTVLSSYLRKRSKLY